MARRASPPSQRRPDARGAGSGGRAPWGTITRQQVVDAAARAVETGQHDQMTIRSLAADLGVAPMTLYRHVRDKDDLLEEVTDRLLARSWRPRASRADWQAWVAEAAELLRALLVSQPVALHVYLRHPVASPAALERMEATLEVLRQAGFDAEAARRTYAAVHTYTVGFAALQASRDRWAASGNRPPDDIPAQLATVTTPEQFADGLRYLLEGALRQAQTG